MNAVTHGDDVNIIRKDPADRSARVLVHSVAQSLTLTMVIVHRIYSRDFRGNDVHGQQLVSLTVK